jgi:hypothetical protein
MPNRIEARSAKAALTNATGRLPLLRLFSTPLVDRVRHCPFSPRESIRQSAGEEKTGDAAKHNSNCFANREARGSQRMQMPKVRKLTVGTSAPTRVLIWSSLTTA